MTKSRKIIAIALSVMIIMLGSILICYSNSNALVSVSVSEITEYTSQLKDSSNSGLLVGKDEKAYWFNITVYNKSPKEFYYNEIKGNNIKCVLNGDMLEDFGQKEIVAFEKQEIPCIVFVDKNMSEEDLRQALTEAQISVMFNNTEIHNLKIDKVI